MEISLGAPTTDGTWQNNSESLVVASGAYKGYTANPPTITVTVTDSTTAEISSVEAQTFPNSRVPGAGTWESEHSGLPAQTGVTVTAAAPGSGDQTAENVTITGPFQIETAKGVSEAFATPGGPPFRLLKPTVAAVPLLSQTFHVLVRGRAPFATTPRQIRLTFSGDPNTITPIGPLVVAFGHWFQSFLVQGPSASRPRHVHATFTGGSSAVSTSERIVYPTTKKAGKAKGSKKAKPSATRKKK